MPGEVVVLAPKGRGRGALDAGIHVSFIIEADVSEIMASFHGAGKRLKADISRAAVTADGNNFRIIRHFYTFALEGFISGFHTGGYGGGIFKKRMDPGYLPCRGRELSAENFGATGGINDNGIVIEGF